MSKKNSHIAFKSVFVCTSAILSLWLGSNLTSSSVHADENVNSNDNQPQVETVVSERNGNQNKNDAKEEQNTSDQESETTTLQTKSVSQNNSVESNDATASNNSQTEISNNQSNNTKESAASINPTDNAKTQITVKNLSFNSEAKKQANLLAEKKIQQEQGSKAQVIQDQTKVVIHYKGDGTKWVPYVWGVTPGSNGVQYKWDGKDADGNYYSIITLDKNYQKIGILIKGPTDWTKDGTGADRHADIGDNGLGEYWFTTGKDEQQKVTPTYDSSKINVHYYGDSSTKSLNYWTDADTTKKSFDLTNKDNELSGNFQLSGKFHKVFVSDADVTREFTPLPGNKATDIYLVKDDNTAYYTKSSALADESLTSASMTDPNTIAIEAGKATTADAIEKKLKLNNDNSISKIEAVDPNADGKSKKFIIHTTKDIDILANNQIGLGSNYKGIDIGSYVRSDAFDAKYAYDGNDLGCIYSKDHTQIKLWAPTAKNVTLNLYDSVNNSATPAQTIVMKRGDKGVWTSIISGDKKGWAYDYSLTFGNGAQTKTDDPYSKAVTVNGMRTVIEDYDNIKPNGFNRMPTFSQPTDAIIYETSIRDFTSDPNSGIKDKGKFLGMIESGKTPTGQVTGLDYLKSLGITHIQIMPSYDFASVDETKDLSNQYNWGYDPKNYDVPEGSYSSDPTNPTARIMEMKEMINGLHKAGIRVIMDVVYNHVYDPKQQAFELTVPGYYFHYDKDNSATSYSGCGNDIAPQRKMVQKYIVDSVTYWAKQYKVDGFRFDIMSLLTPSLMNQVRSALNKVDPGILTYGEGWDMDDYTKLEGTTQLVGDKVPGVGFFSDDMRNSVKGEDDNVRVGLIIGDGQEDNFDTNAKKFVDAFIRGKNLKQDAWEPHIYATPSQMINYAACHDNRTLYDYIKKALPNESDEMIAKRVRLANSMVMLSDGIPFFYGGQEALRTKNGDSNSYNSSVKENEIDWERVGQNKKTVDYFKQLAQLRKNLPILGTNSFDEMQKSSKIVSDGRTTDAKGNVKGVFAFEYQESNGKKLYIVFNVNNKNTNLKGLDLTKGSKLLDSEGNVKLSDDTVLAPLSTLVVEEGQEKPDQPTSPSQPTTPEQPVVPISPVTPVIPDNNTSSEIPNKSDLDKQLTLYLTHNAYIYDKDLQIAIQDNGQKIVLKKDEEIHPLDNGRKYTLQGKEFYRIGDNQFVKASNTVSYYKLRLNSFVYAKNGKAVKKNGKHILLRRNIRINLRSERIVKIGNKKFYQLDNGKFVKVRNVVKVVVKNK